jgi:Ca2+-binding EF-hand superfamily protein
MGSAAAKLLHEPENKSLAEATFRTYDKDRSGKLDDRELRFFAVDLLKGLGAA